MQNNMTGSIPESIGTLSLLQYMYVESTWPRVSKLALLTVNAAIADGEFVLIKMNSV